MKRPAKSRARFVAVMEKCVDKFPLHRQKQILAAKSRARELRLAEAKQLVLAAARRGRFRMAGWTRLSFNLWRDIPDCPECVGTMEYRAALADAIVRVLNVGLRGAK